MQEYWAFSYEEMGIYDDVANIDLIKEQTSKDKIFYLGYSQGTIQMFYALIKKGKAITDNLIKFVALAPCTVADESSLDPMYEDGIFKM